MSQIDVGMIRGFRIQIVGYDDNDETGFARKVILVPEEGEPAVWNGSKWETVEELTKGWGK